jgi:long-chain acyl-CoA synthetase
MAIVKTAESAGTDWPAAVGRRPVVSAGTEPPRTRAAPAAPPGFIERFLRHAATTPDAIAVENADTGELVTFQALRARAERLRAALEAQGVGRSDPILLVQAAPADLLTSFLAVTSLEAMAIPVSPDLTEFELRPIVADAHPVGVIASTLSAPLFAGLAGCETLRFLFTSDDSARRNPLPPTAAGGQSEGTPCSALPDCRSELVSPSLASIVSCHFTYRGLGYPLGALHTYADYAWLLQAANDCFPGAGGAAAAHLAALPLYAIYGIVSGMLFPLCNGSRIVTSSGDVCDLLWRRQIRFACLVPLLLRSVIGKAREQRLRGAFNPDLEILSGGSLLSRDAANDAAEMLGVMPYQGYGLTEALPVTSNRMSHCRPDSLGVPLLAQTTIEILDHHGQSLPPGEVGEVAIIGPTVMAGYLGRPAETALFLRGGRLLTGDLGALDAEGYLYFHGRCRQFTKIASQMVDLVQVERVLALHPAVERASVHVRHDPRIGERLSASVTLREGATVSKFDLMALCRRHLSGHKVPRTIHFSNGSEPALAGVATKGIGS